MQMGTPVLSIALSRGDSCLSVLSPRVHEYLQEMNRETLSSEESIDLSVVVADRSFLH